MAVKTTAAGKMDKRTKEYKELKDRLAYKARAAKAKASAPKKQTTKLKKTVAGKVDKRTKEGKEIAARMAKARKAKGSLVNRLKRLFR
ncbi:MAG: hypothetical protein K2N79_00190 [Muribaculaceae bacterium]|nr:hypothetical protein [Muribaculaceae bacterium]MDE7369768.1 hypothetical protein [Muribaculaceae bacterium]